MIVYKVTNIVNGMVYIGCTSRSVQKRKAGHQSKQANPSPLNLAIHEFGRECFSWRILWSGESIDAMGSMEKKFIALYDCMIPKGYNKIRGGETHLSEPGERTDISLSIEAISIIDELSQRFSVDSSTIIQMAVWGLAEREAPELVENFKPDDPAPIESIFQELEMAEETAFQC
jgi:hypothetical protein